MYIYKLFFVFLVVNVLFFYTGHIVRQIVNFKKNKYIKFSDVFISSLIGLSFTIVSFAMIKSTATSIYIIIIILSLIYLKINKTKLSYKINFKVNITSSLALYLGIGIVSTFVYWILLAYNFKEDEVLLALPDFHFYSDISRGLIKTGIENRHNRLFDFYQLKDSFLYHYFDSWTGAFISSISKVNTFDVQMMIVFPLFFFLTILGTASCIELKNIKMNLIFIISILTMFSLSFYFLNVFSFSVLNFWGSGFMPGIYYGMKLLCIYPFILLAIRSLMQNKILEFLLLLLITSVVYNMLFVWILTGIFCVGIIIIYKNKKETGLYLSTVIKQYIFVLGLFLFSLLTYTKLFISKSSSINETEISYLTNIKPFLIILIEHIIKNGIFYIPTILIFLLVINKIKFKQLNVLIFFVFFVGGFFSTAIFITFMHKSPNFSQAFTNFNSSFALCIFIFSLMHLKENWIKPAIIFMFILSSINIQTQFKEMKGNVRLNKNYSKSYLTKVLKTIKPHDKFVFCNPKNDLWFCYDIATFTSKLRDNCSGFNVSLDTKNTYNSLSPLNVWCKTKNKTLNYYSLIEYLKNKKIKFIFSLDKNSFPKQLLKNYKLVYEDSKSKECFYQEKE